MKLKQLLRRANITYSGEDCDIVLITDDSRKCKPSSVFVCHKNVCEYVNQAKENGAVLVIASEKVCENCIVVEDTRKTYTTLCREFFCRADEKLNLIAVTGTNGKTSVSLALRYILEMNGIKCGVIGTVSGGENCENKSNMTTPDPFEIFSMLSAMVDASFKYCVVEASSQGLSQDRLYGIEFQFGIFTNLTEDHLDYHQTMENYKNAKLSLFFSCKNAIINYDDTYSAEFQKACFGKVVTYSAKSDEANFTAKNVRLEENFVGYELVSDSLIFRVGLRLCGDFWVSNSLAAIVCAYEIGIPCEKIIFALKSFSGVKGRMELVETNSEYKIIIDYAHTEDALKNALVSLKRFCKGRLILVFGCGGDREKQKRALMGQIASTYAEIIFLTNDNPRTENPQEIIDNILLGIKKRKSSVYIVQDRKKAIEKAIKTAKKDDIILLAGKGHETYQIIEDEKYPFDERKIISQLLNK